MKALKPLGALAVLAILLATATAVFAAPPVFSTFDGQGTDEYDCGDFSIVDEWTVMYATETSMTTRETTSARQRRSPSPITGGIQTVVRR